MKTSSPDKAWQKFLESCGDVFAYHFGYGNISLYRIRREKGGWFVENNNWNGKKLSGIWRPYYGIKFKTGFKAMEHFFRDMSGLWMEPGASFPIFARQSGEKVFNQYRARPTLRELLEQGEDRANHEALQSAYGLMGLNATDGAGKAMQEQNQKYLEDLKALPQKPVLNLAEIEILEQLNTPPPIVVKVERKKKL
jgi:hypothetical protein